MVGCVRDRSFDRITFFRNSFQKKRFVPSKAQINCSFGFRSFEFRTNEILRKKKYFFFVPLVRKSNHWSENQTIGPKIRPLVRKQVNWSMTIYLIRLGQLLCQVLCKVGLGVRLGQVRLGLVWFGLVRLGQVRLGLVSLGYVRFVIFFEQTNKYIFEKTYKIRKIRKNKIQKKKMKF